VADALREQIRSGDLQVGGRLPTHYELVEQFAVSRATVQRALKELQEAGYVEAEQGRGVFVTDWREHEHAGTAGPGASRGRESAEAVDLDDVIAEAFEAEEITIDAFCLTSESLNAAVVPQVGRIQRGELHPRSIKVRLLLPRTENVRLAIPRLVNDPEVTDRRPLERLQHLIGLHTEVLKNAVEGLVGWGEGSLEEAVVETRQVPLTPVFKTYLINGERGLTGYYVVMNREVRLPDGEEAAIYDVIGPGAKLYPHGPMQRQECQWWFDSLWATIAEQM
jgi:DNA-binding transcriptional regulator YhcF (GntR family)